MIDIVPTPSPPAHSRSPAPSVREWVARYRDRGLAVCRLAAGRKQPDYAGWPARPLEPHAFGPGDGVGILCGALSDGGRPGHALVCVDLDAAAALERADEFLPPTGMVDGRPGKPRAHRYYLVPCDSISHWAVSTAPQAVRAARNRGLHPGPFVKHFKLADGTAAFDVIGTGGQVAAPPTVHASGEVRAWAGGACGDPAAVAFEELWAGVNGLATAVVCRVPAGLPGGRGAADGTAAADGADPPGTALSRGPSALAGRPPTPEDVSADRVTRAEEYLAAIPDADLSRSGRGGHDTLFRHLSAVAHGLRVNDPGVLQDLFDRAYTARLRGLHARDPGGGYEPWTAAELTHKVADVLAAGPPAGKAPGWLLAPAIGDADGLPRAWDDPRRLAEGVAACYPVWFADDTAYRYHDTGYQVAADGAVRAVVQTHAEEEAVAAYRARCGTAGAGVAVPATLSGPAGPGPIAGALRAGKPPGVVPPVTARVVGDALASLRALRRLPVGTELDTHLGDGRPRDWLTVTNGILDLDTRRLLPHTSDWLSLVTLPVAYDPAAPPPANWLRFLGEVMENDAGRVALLQEVAGWCLDRGSRVQAFVVAAGAGANGKSVFFHVLRSLLGPRNCAAVGLNQLTGGGHRFAAFGLLGKLANVKGDQGYLESEDEAALKELTGGDLFQFEQKGKQPVFAVNRAKLLFGCNAVPTFTDKSDGVWRRLVPVPFEWTVPADRRDPAMLTDAYWAGEMPGILTWALEGLARLRGRGRFDLPAACQALLAQHRLDSNPARQYLAEGYEYTAVDVHYVPIDDLYTGYTMWCAASGFRHPLTKPRFGKEVSAHFPGAKSIPGRQPGVRGRVRLGIRPIDAGRGPPRGVDDTPPAGAAPPPGA